MILNTKSLIVVPQPAMAGMKPWTDQITVAAPPNTKITDVVAKHEQLVVLPWHDYGPEDVFGAHDPDNYTSGVEFFAFDTGHGYSFQEAWENAQSDWLTNVFIAIKMSAEAGDLPEEVFDFGLTPSLIDFIFFGDSERKDWGIRRVPKDSILCDTRPIVRSEVTIATWNDDQFPVGTTVQYEEEEDVLEPLATTGFYQPTI